MSQNSKIEILKAHLSEFKNALEQKILVDAMNFFALLELLEAEAKADIAMRDNLIAHAGAIIAELNKMFPIKSSEIKQKLFKLQFFLDEIILSAFLGNKNQKIPQE